MKISKTLSQTVFIQKARVVISTLILLILACILGAQPTMAQKDWGLRTLRGIVEGNGGVQAGYDVSLYVSEPDSQSGSRILGTATTQDDGMFEIHYRLPKSLPYRRHAVYYVLAENGLVMLSSAIGAGRNIPDNIVVNERTTVAIGTAFAQFVQERKILGNKYGMVNAVNMAANMADPKTGAVSAVLLNPPNRNETSTYRTFNSLTNVVASCIADEANCLSLFTATTPAGGPAPHTVLHAVANIPKYPWYPGYPANDLDPLFVLSELNPINHPALPNRPTSWLLFIKFTGGFYSEQDEKNLMNGPGNIAIDERGFSWVTNNYVPQPETTYACAGLRLLKFTPSGQPFPRSPYFGGGLSGVGFGITLDPRGRVWVGNFGFQAPACGNGIVPPDKPNKIPATHNSVSLFRSNGVPLSGSQGFTKGHISWPQATVSDRKGNIWMANCGNDSVTIYPKGHPWRAKNISLGGDPLPPLQDPSDPPQIKPFGIAIDPNGHAWVTGNKSQEVYRISSHGKVVKLRSDGLISWPMGISGDSQGNMWVSNSDSVNVPCNDEIDPQSGENPS
ncbi:MAG: hypothetical protein JSU59_02670, partial [Nitrospirota bacterium]